MKIYGVRYDDYTNGEQSWVDDDIYKSLEAATKCARDTINSIVEELNRYDDGEYGPYTVDETSTGDLPTFTVLNNDGVSLEALQVVQFNLVESYKNG